MKCESKFYIKKLSSARNLAIANHKLNDQKLKIGFFYEINNY